MREIRELLGARVPNILSAADLNLPESEETGDTFVANAELKARASATAAQLPALADDSGLAVDALGGAPGIFSARWAGPQKDFGAAMRLVEEKLRAAGATTPEKRTARFVAALSLAWPDGTSEEWRGEVAGTLVWPPRGDKGFGYDPIFLPDGHQRTFGEMSAEEKHGRNVAESGALSHRARAFARFARDQLLVEQG